MSDDERRGAAFLLGVVSYLRRQLDAEVNDAKKKVGLVSGERLAITTPQGATIGYVTMANGKKSVYVYDWSKVVEFLEIHYPEAVITTVDPQWWEARKADILKRGALISKDGEVCEEVTVTQGDPYVMTKLDESVGAYEILDRMFKSRAVTFNPTAVKAIAARAVSRKKTTK